MNSPDRPGGFEDLHELSYAGIRTFLKADTAPPDDLPAGTEVAVAGVPFDGAVSREPGARHGPQGIRDASAWFAHLGNLKNGLLNLSTGAVVSYADLPLRDCGDVPVVPTSVERTRDQVQGFVHTVSTEAFPLVLGGDHYATFPSFVGHAAATDGTVGMLYLDGHSDTTAESSLYGRHFHGTPNARIHESEYGGFDRTALVGIRGYESPEFPDIVDDHDMHVSYASDVHEEGVGACLDEAVAYLRSRVDRIYLSVDMDCVDPAFAPGVGTPEPGGLTSSQFLDAMERLGYVDEIGALDLMEVAPDRDPTGFTPLLAAGGIVRFLETKFL